MRAELVGVTFAAPLALPASAGPSGSPCPRDARLGSVAFVRGGALHLFSLADCHDRVLVARGTTAPVRFSRDGHPIEYGNRRRVRVTGGRPRRVPPPTALPSPDGRLVAEVRSTRLAPPRSRRTASTAKRSASRAPPQMLLYRDYVAWCGRRLVITAGRSRLATERKGLAVAAPPSWRARRLLRTRARAWGSVSCLSRGALAVQSQPVRRRGLVDRAEASLTLHPNWRSSDGRRSSVPRRPLRPLQGDSQRHGRA